MTDEQCHYLASVLMFGLNRMAGEMRFQFQLLRRERLGWTSEMLAEYAKKWVAPQSDEAVTDAWAVWLDHREDERSGRWDGA